MNILINGLSGRMGQELQNLITSSNSKDKLLGGLDQEGFKIFKNQTLSLEKDPNVFAKCLKSTEMILDFSNQEGNEALLKKLKLYSKEKNLPLPYVLIGTTALKKTSLKSWEILAKQSNFACLIAPNTSMGVFLLSKSIQYLSKQGYIEDLDIVMDEIHHKHKIDSPSGTALWIQESFGKTLSSKITIHSHRGGGVPGIHNVMFLGEQEILEFKHTAFSRKLFADGALKMARRLIKLKSGFYTLWDL